METGHVVGGAQLHADTNTVIAYVGERSEPKLQLGAGARIRSGTILYAGSTIGSGLQTGHNVVVQPSNRLAIPTMSEQSL